MELLNSLVGSAVDSLAGIPNKAVDMASSVLGTANTALSSVVGDSVGGMVTKAVIGGAIADAAASALSGGIGGALGGLLGGVKAGLDQAATADILRDYQHASKTFVSNNLARSPKMGNLYHVFFEVNSAVAEKAGLKGSVITDTGIMVKSVTLPNFQVDTKTLNAYNRPNIVQSKIKYDPVTIMFHDDMLNMVRDFWISYYAYYYGDTTQKSTVYNAPHKYNVRQSANWGYNSAVSQPLLNSIKIYQLHKKNFSLVQLMNPIIKSWQHGTMSAGSNETVDHSMSIEFEAVRYSQGTVSGNTVSGFGMASHYDKKPSPLVAKGGGTRSLLGVGGLTDSTNSVLSDFASGNIGSAALGAMRMAKTFGGADFGAMAQTELKAAATDLVLGAVAPAFGKFTFPGAPTAKTTD